jgi:Domain of unknown function (DUF4350)
VRRVLLNAGGDRPEPLAARRRLGRRRLQPLRVGLGFVAVIVAVNIVLRVLGTLTGGTPGGPQSSSYATAPAGAAAYAELLGRAGHPIDQVRSLPRDASPSPDATVLLLDPPSVAPADVDALAAFVRAGGRLVASGLSQDAMRKLGAGAPSRVRGRRSARAGGLAIRTDGLTWRAHGFLLVSRLGSGVVDLLPDASPLQNRLLGAAGNAAFGLALAGPPARPVEFLESYHGYGRSAGLSALPFAWKLLLGGLALAALVWLVARGRRFGPPEPEGRDLSPPRREYVDSLAGVLLRGRRRDEAVEPVRREARRVLLARAALPSDAADADLEAAARRLGMPDDEAKALLQPARTDADVLSIGRALARIGEDRR